MDGNKAPCDVLLGRRRRTCLRAGGHRFPATAVGNAAARRQTGVLDLAALDAALGRHAGRRVMLALQAANNETGVIQPVAEAAATGSRGRRARGLRRGPGGRPDRVLTLRASGADVLFLSGP